MGGPFGILDVDQDIAGRIAAPAVTGPKPNGDALG
jgi:hypothetical protein